MIIIYCYYCSVYVSVYVCLCLYMYLSTSSLLGSLYFKSVSHDRTNSSAVADVSFVTNTIQVPTPHPHHHPHPHPHPVV